MPVPSKPAAAFRAGTTSPPPTWRMQLIGHVAEWTSLPLALGLIPILTAVIVIVTPPTDVLTSVARR